MKADFVQTMKILVLCEAVALFVCCVGYQENPNIPGNTEQFWYNTLVRYKKSITDKQYLVIYILYQ